MTVEELVEKLMSFDPNARVAVYSNMGEDMDMARDVKIQSKDNPESFLYCKVVHPLDPENGWVQEDEVVCIC